MKTRTLHKALSMLLTAAMVMNMGLTPVFAAEGVTPPGVSGVCTHHAEHTEDCGYRQGTPCGHAHTEDCYKVELTCPITTGDTAGDAPEVATDSNAVVDSGNGSAGVPHTHGEDCYTKTDNCKHTHDDTCGYTPDSPCRFDAASCTQCSPGDKPAEQVCTCQPVDSGTQIHGENCPLYIAPPLSEAVQALIALVDALPNPEDITEENREATLTDFEAAAEAYGALSEDDKAAFDKTPQHTKLRALDTALYPVALMANSPVELDITDVSKDVEITATGYKVGGGTEISYTGDYIITGSMTSSNSVRNHITVSSGTHNITLRGVTIGIGTKKFCAFEITGDSTVNLTLEGTNTLKSGPDKAGLQVTEGNTLTITDASTGSLTSTGGYLSAGIGGGNGGNGGTITINGGTVTATGGSTGAGIGGGNAGAGGEITISGGEVTATGGQSGAGIGGGNAGAGGEITISGGEVTATGGDRGAGIGGGDSGAGGSINISGGTVKANGGSDGAGIGGRNAGTGGNITISGGEVTATGGSSGAGIGGGYFGSGGDITISGGKVTATGGQYGAGIGGGYFRSGGDITISGGEVTATGGQYGAGIGGGESGAGGSITIDGNAVVYASKGTDAPNHIGAGAGATGGTVNKTRGIIFEGASGAVYGSVILGQDLTIAPAQTLTIGSTLEIGSGATLSNNGIINNKGTIVNNGILKALGTQSGTGTLTGDSIVQMTLSGSMITLPQSSYVYTGSSIIPTVAVATTLWGKELTFIKDTDYTVTGSDNTVVGTSAKATVTPNGGDTALTGTAVEKTFTITQSDTAFTGGIKTYKDTNEQSTFTYGDTITVKVTVAATGTAPAPRSRAVPTANQMALFKGTVQLTEPQTVTSGTELTFTIATTDKQLAIGENAITAKYVESTNMAGHEQTITITLNPKPLTATVNTSHASATKVYDGNANFTGVALTLTGLEAVDSGITATASGTAANANVDTSKAFTATRSTLSGTGKECYTLDNNAITGNVSITAATPTVSVTAVKKVSRLRTVIGDHNDTIVLTATTGGANGEKPNGKVTFKHGTTTLATVNTTNGVATYDWANPPAGNITVTAEFTASDSNYISTAVKGTYEFGISKVEQAALTIAGVPSTVTYGDVKFTLSTTGGSGTGAVSYAVTAGNAVSVNATTGEVTILKVGTATITATKAADSNYNAKTATVDIEVDTATPTISWGSNTAQTVTYTGTEAVLPNLPTVTGIAAGDTSNGTITYQHKSTATKLTNLFGLLEGYTAGLPTNAGEYKIVATVAADGNYAAADSAEMTLTINKITSTLAINAMAGKTYDGTAIANPTNITSNITNPAVTYTYYKDNGSNAKGVKLSGAPKDAGNYWVEGSIAETGNTTAVTSNAVSFTITKAPLTVAGGTVTRREYDGTTAATVTALTFSGLQNGEALAIATDYTVGTPVYDSADAGTNKTVSGTAVLESNVKTSNYALTGTYSITNQTIDKKTGIAAPSYTAMDNTGTTKSFTFGTVSGYTDVTAYEWKLEGDSDWTAVTVNPITFGNRAGKMQVRVKATTNYEAGAILTHSTAFTATLEGSVSIDGTATYGETLTAKPTGTQTGAVLSYEWKSGTTVLQAKSASDTYKIAGAAVGNTITVEVTATSYTGSLTDTTAAVAKKAVTATATTISKVYDGTAAVEAADQTLTIAKVNASDDITVTMPSAAYANKNTGSGIPIAVGGLTITGAAKDWYTVTAPSSVTGEITFKALTVGDGALAITKEYDTTTAFTTSTGSLSLTGVVGGETVGVKIDSYGNAADANVGTKTLSLGISLDGADKDNYTVTSPYSFTKASITAKAIIPTIESIAAVTYDGTAKEPALTVKDGNTVLAASDYTAIYSDNTNAGENTGKVAVTLKGNYDGSANATFTIHKAAGLTATTPNNILMIKGQEEPYTFNLSTIALNKTDAGAKTYTVGALTDSNSIFKVAPSISGAEMTFTSNSIETPATNQATQIVTISTQNYADTTVTISFDITDKTPVTITGLTAATNLVYNGSAQNGYTGTAQFAPAWSGTLTYTYYEGTGTSGTKLSGAPSNAGTYTVVASIPDSDTSMAGSHAPVTFTIGAKEITVAKGSYKVSKTYDGMTSAGTSSGTLNVTGILPTDGGVTVVPGAIPAYSDSAVKSNYDIALPITISGDTNSNYKLAASTVTVPGEITKASVTATIEPIADQTYTGSQQRPTVTVKVGGSTIADSNYTVEYGANVNAGTGSVTVKAKATGNYTFGDVTANFTINKAAGPAISGAVTGSYTGNGTTFTYTIASISGAEYKVDSGAWQDSNVFASIQPQTKHTFSARMKETANYEASAEKAGNEVNFAKLSGVAAPALAYTVTNGTSGKTITITTVTGAEYQFGADAWSDTNTKAYSTDETVTIGIRMKTTPTHEAGTAATASVNLAKQEQTAPAAFTLTYAANGETNYTVTIPEVAGCEYSFDGATYNSTRTKTASVGDTVTGYMRKAETDTHNASPAVSASVTLPMFKVQPITASPSDRNFSGSTSVSLASDTAGAEIYYTTNGSTPSIASTKYTAAFTLTETTTVKAIAIKTGMTDSDVASFTFTKNSGGGGTGGGGGVTPAPDPKPETPTTPTTAESNVNSKTDKDGNATAAVEEKDITNAIDKAQKEAKKNGTEANGIAITLNVKTDKNASTLGVTLPQKSVSALIAANVTSVTVKNGLSTVTLALPH